MDKQSKNKELITRGVANVVVRDSLEAKLASGKKLRIKLGVDPTSARMHLGHTVVLRKLRQFQELGHKVIFLVGDFTAQIGDPSDKLSARQPLSKKAIKQNMETYKQQAGKILDLSKAEIRYNSEWHNDMDLAELFQLAAMFTVNQMLERDMFQKRIEKKRPLWIHELMYPILQGYDSVALQADVELGGTDQTFNMLAARTIQPAYNQAPQDIMTVQLLEGTDGQDKMSKSVGNTIDLTETPQDMFGKIMSIPDKLIGKYFRLLTDVPEQEIRQYEQAMEAGNNPRNYKERLGIALVALYHDKIKAQTAAEEFKRMFSQKQAPENLPSLKIKKNKNYTLLELVVEAKLAPSKSEARRLIEQGAVELDNKQVKDWKAAVKVEAGQVLKVGKRKFVRLAR